MRFLFDQDLEFISPANIINHLNLSDTEYDKISEMTKDERTFLLELINRYKPKKILELGVSKGGSSLLILDSIKNIADSFLYSIDLNEYWYKNDKYKTGYFVDNYPTLKDKWKLYTGNLAYKYMEDIGSNIDFCLIDTVHCNPGEILDFLIVLPYLKDDSIVVFHDTNLHAQISTDKWVEHEYTNNMLMSAIFGKKFIQGHLTLDAKQPEFPNIGAIKLTPETKRHIFEVFNLLTIRWFFPPTKEQISDMAIYFEKHYGQEWKEYFVKVADFQRRYNLSFSGKSHKSILQKLLNSIRSN